MPESAAESALCLDDGKTHTRLHSLHPLRTPQTWKVTSARAAGEEKFELGLPFTLVSGLFSGPRLRAAAGPCAPPPLVAIGFDIGCARVAASILREGDPK